MTSHVRFQRLIRHSSLLLMGGAALIPFSSPAQNIEPQAVKPAVEITPVSVIKKPSKPAEYQPTWSPIAAVDQVRGEVEKKIMRISYTPLSAIAVFPVFTNAQSHAFGDVSLVLAKECASQLESKAKGARIINPETLLEELQVRHLDGLYERVIASYIRGGRPNPRLLNELLLQLTADGMPIQRVVFVEANVEMLHPGEPTNVLDHLIAWSTDGLPKNSQMTLKAHMKVYETEDDRAQLVWSVLGTKNINGKRVYAVSSSVFNDPSNVRTFSNASRWLSLELLTLAPQTIYLKPVPVPHQANVEGQVVPNLEGVNPTPDPSLTAQDKAAIQRVLGQHAP